MKVSDFVKMETSGALFTVVDANKVGYMTRPDVITVGDKNVLTMQFADAEVIGFEPKTARNITVYVKE